MGLFFLELPIKAKEKFCPPCADDKAVVTNFEPGIKRIGYKLQIFFYHGCSLWVYMIDFLDGMGGSFAFDYPSGAMVLSAALSPIPITIAQSITLSITVSWG